jgi:predicted alpha/beta-fold hydrolase
MWHVSEAKCLFHGMNGGSESHFPAVGLWFLAKMAERWAGLYFAVRNSVKRSESKNSLYLRAMLPVVTAIDDAYHACHYVRRDFKHVAQW